MFQIKSFVPDHLVDLLETFFYESDGVSNWSLESIPGGHDFQLFGFFDSPDAAREAWSFLRTQFAEIPDNPESKQLPDRDWKEAYKDHFKPWSRKGLHWVPLWERESYFVPNGEAALYMDPGMAFGTGNHETTRLCVEGLLNYRAAIGGEETTGHKIVDAGCGSGILSLSAWLLGFRDVEAFDIDADSIHVCHENAAVNGLEKTVHFFQGDLSEAIISGKADLILANILANVLIENRECILRGLNLSSSSCLILSGILDHEANAVELAYRETLQALGVQADITRMNMGQWSALNLQISG
jgi:ribosomal protein L11 methyltransferase